MGRMKVTKISSIIHMETEDQLASRRIIKEVMMRGSICRDSSKLMNKNPPITRMGALREAIRTTPCLNLLIGKKSSAAISVI